MRYKLDFSTSLDMYASDSYLPGQSSCFTGQRIHPAKGLEEETWPSKTRLFIVEKNVIPAFNIGLASPSRRAQNRSLWLSLVMEATSLTCPEMCITLDDDDDDD